MLDKKNSFEVIDDNPAEDKAVESELTLEDKVEELKQQAKERVLEIEADFQELLSSVDGWGNDSEPEYRQKIHQLIAIYLRKGLDFVEKKEGLALVQGGYYEEVLSVFDTLRRRIANMILLEDDIETNPVAKQKLEILANGALSPKGELSFTQAGKSGSGYPVNDWDFIAKK